MVAPHYLLLPKAIRVVPQLYELGATLLRWRQFFLGKVG